MASDPRRVTVVGAGPNGLTAALHLAMKGLAVRVLEYADTPGGGCRTSELTLPGFRHDVCSAVHPLGVSSPALKALSLEDEGLEWLWPEVALAHPLDGEPAVIAERDLAATAASIGADGAAYRDLVGPVAGKWDELLDTVLDPRGVLRHPLMAAGFGLKALRSARGLGDARFKCRRARALFAGLAAHGMLPVETPGTAAFGLLLAGSLHSVGWPVARGGSASIIEAMTSKLSALGGEVHTGACVTSADELDPDELLVLTLTPRQLLRFGGARIPSGYARTLRRYRYGAGVCKVDWALSGPIPWRDPECARAATVHVSGREAETSSSERQVARGRHPERPYVIVVQPTVVDPSRAPPGKHVGWAYCHVPNGSGVDMSGAIEAQIERFAPGFGECILGRNVITASGMERYNPSYVGGDISAGAQDLAQTFMRPVAGFSQHRLPVKGWYACSAATPPGGGVHGMCGYHAAMRLLEDLQAGTGPG